MNTQITIQLQSAGNYKITYKENGTQKACLIAANYVNSLLNMGQKENLFMGQTTFKISEYDFINTIIKGQERPGLGKINRTPLL